MNKDLRKYIKEKGITYRKHQDFLIEYINNNGNATKAYKSTINSSVSDASAAVMGCNILKKLNIDDLLDYSGHGPDKMMRAMERLYKEDPKEYMKYQSKFRKLDESSIQINHTVDSAIDKLKGILEDEQE